MKKLKKADISANAIEYYLCGNGIVKHIRSVGSDALNYSTDDYSISNNDSIPFYISLGETLKIKDKKYFTRARDTSCYVRFDDLDKINWDKCLIDDQKICIDFKNNSLVSSDYQLITKEKFEELKNNRVAEYFES